jgi:PEP-CTERM motif
MKKTALSLFSVLLAAVFMLPSAAHADTINFVLNNPTQSGAPGSTLTYSATVTAPGTNGGAVSLDADNFTGSGPFVIDDSSFFNNFPLSLDPSQSYTGTLFTLFIPNGTPAGLYTGGSVQIFFSDVTGLQSYVSQDFVVDIPGSSPVPEPGTWVLLVTGTGLLAAVVYSRRRTTGLARAA